MADTSFFQQNNSKEITRRRKMAERLMKQGEQDGSTQIVSGYAVKKSPLEGLAKALTSGIGQYQETKADTMQTELDKKRAELMAQAVEAYGQDPTAASKILMQDPEMSGEAMKMAMSGMDEQREAQAKEFNWQRNADLQRELAGIRGGAMTYQFDPSSGSVIPVQAPPQPRKLSAKEQQEVFDMQDKLDATKGVISALGSAKEIYSRTGEDQLKPQPYTGFGADTLTSIARVPLIGDLIADKGRAAATTEASNLVTEQALSNLRAIFGGNPTEGERNILLQLQALPTFTPQEQSAIINRAQQAAQRRMGDYQNRLSNIETGQYFGQSQNPYAGQGNQAVNTPYDQIQPLLSLEQPVQPMQGGNMPPPSPMQGGMGGQPISFNTPQEAEQANLPVGTVIMVGGRKAVVE